MQNDEWIEVAVEPPSVTLARMDRVRRPQPKAAEPCEWVVLDRLDARTWPAPGRRIEFDTAPGGIVKRAGWYRHAFGRRSGLDVVTVTVLDVDIPIRNLLRWRYADA
jgi:hypothetical protein